MILKILDKVAKKITTKTLNLEISGLEKIPKSGKIIFVANHVTELDPIFLYTILGNQGIYPKFLAKAELFRIPILGKLLKHLGHIPVHRGSRKAKDALIQAEKELEHGSMVLIFPEGRLTYNPDYTPIKGKTGVARLAQKTGAVVVPIVHYGAHKAVEYSYNQDRKVAGRKWYLLPRKTVQIMFGEPIENHELEQLEAAESTNLIMNIMGDMYQQLSERTNTNE